MNRYYAEPASAADRAESGNPDLVYVRGSVSGWLCACDAADAPNIIAAMELRETLLHVANLDENPAAQVVS